MGFRLKIAHPESNAPVLKTVTQHRNQSVGIAGIVKRHAELADRVAITSVNKARPLIRLGCLNKADKGIGIETHSGVICIGGFGVATFLGQQEGLNILFKPSFIRYHYWLVPLSIFSSARFLYPNLK
jgi:hypothetical protein